MTESFNLTDLKELTESSFYDAIHQDVGNSKAARLPIRSKKSSATKLISLEHNYRWAESTIDLSAKRDLTR